MAHFAQLNENNVVLQVIVVHNNELLDDNNQEIETLGVAFCQSLFGQDTVWRQTSYNASIRKNYAGVGFNYDADRDAFIPPKPFPSWVLDEDTCLWGAPTPMPTEGGPYQWDEATTSWVKVALDAN